MIKIRDTNINSIEAWDIIYRKERIKGKIRTNDPIWEPFVKYIPGNAKIIDVGCGSGGFLRYIKNIRPSAVLAGIEYSNEALITAKTICSDAKYYNYFLEVKDKFDVAVCSEVMEHITDNVEFMGNIIDLVSVGGLIITTTPWRWDYTELYHVWDYRESQDIIDLTNGKCELIDTWIHQVYYDMCVVMRKL